MVVENASVESARVMRVTVVNSVGYVKVKYVKMLDIQEMCNYTLLYFAGLC